MINYVTRNISIFQVTFDVVNKQSAIQENVFVLRVNLKKKLSLASEASVKLD